MSSVTVKIPYYNSANLPPKDAFVSSNPSKVQESPLDARSPQEVLEKYGMYRDQTYYGEHPDKLYLDLTQFDDFETSMNNIIRIRDKFDKLPSSVRAKFNNDISQFVDYCNSKEFKLEYLMDDRIKASYDKYKAEEKVKAEIKAYQQSAEYKSLEEEALLRKRFEEEQFAAWKNSHSDLKSTITH